jgi:hypothetical protein
LKRKSLESLSIFELTARYAQTASFYAQAIDACDSKTANKQYDVLAAIEKELKKRPEGHAAITNAMKSDDRGVRYCAAILALSVSPREAEAVLEEIASGPRGMLRLSAEVTLEEWRKGNFEPYW